MARTKINIAIVDSSYILVKGLSTILAESFIECRILSYTSLREVEATLEGKEVDIIVIDPSFVRNREKDIKKWKRTCPKLQVVGIISTLFNNHARALFDATFDLFETEENIVNTIHKLTEKVIADVQVVADDKKLSERELEVLIHLIRGCSNKEIGEQLNISVHTVVTHRKNITVKTGIRSQSGLTIYAISNNIVSMEDFVV